MEIDLELPSGLEDKLQEESTANSVDDTDGLQIGENDTSSSGTRIHVQETSGYEVGGDAPKIDVSNKEVGNYEPQKGLEFETKEAAYSFYREYARIVGFGITIKASRRSKKSGKFIDVKIACSRFGSKREPGAAINSRSCPKTDCKASMHMKRRQDGKWFIHSFMKEHNHEICPDDFYYAIRGRNKQSGVVCQKKGLQLALDEADIRLLMEYFMLLQAESPNFFYTIDLDPEKRLRNIFWADAKGRHDYRSFSDVILFDTSYIRNKYRIPFVPIVGVNHHCQFMLLGCALIGDETTSSFVWAMRAWLRAVSGQAPKVIITDEEKSLIEATKEVFPNTRHCFFLWHVLAKLHENLGHMTDQVDDIMLKFNKCIYQSWTDEEFEKRWWKMVDKFELREAEWINSLYKDRERWVPTYTRETFLAGMCTTKRSESISSYFDKYVDRETTLKDFIDQYKVFLRERYDEEAKAEGETLQGQPTLRSLSPFEKQMSKLYTHAIFKKFQNEVLGIDTCRVYKECEDEITVTFRVDDFEERQNFVVVWNEQQQDICCLCRSFEYRGFLCRHAMIVLQTNGVSSIPSHYVLTRWTKDALKIRETSCEISNSLHYRVQRFNDLCKRAIKLGEEGSISEETYEIALQALEEAWKHCANLNHSVHGMLEPSTMTTQGLLKIEEESHGCNTAKASKKKKVHKKRKAQHEQEVISIQDSRQPMEQLSPRAHAPENCYIPQPGHEMEQGCRGPSLGGYYSAQQCVLGMGQSNSISSMRDVFYSNQQGLVGRMGQLYPASTRVGYATQQGLQGFDWIQQ